MLFYVLHFINPPRLIFLIFLFSFFPQKVMIDLGFKLPRALFRFSTSFSYLL